MIVLCSVQNFGYYGIMIWLPNYLSTRFGYGLTQSAVWTAVTIAGMALGIFLFGHFADRFGRRPAFFAYMLGAAIMVVVYSQSGRSDRAVGRRRRDGLLRQRHVGRVWRADQRTLSDLRPRDGAERLLQYRQGVAGFGPLAVGAISARYGFHTAIALLALLYVVDIVALLLLVPERVGAELA